MLAHGVALDRSFNFALPCPPDHFFNLAQTDTALNITEFAFAKRRGGIVTIVIINKYIV